MQWFHDLKMAAKLGLGFFSVLLLTASLGIFSIVQLAGVNHTSTDLETNWLPSVEKVSAMATDIANFRAAELQHILSTDDKEMARYEKSMSDILSGFERDRGDYIKLVSSPEEQKLYDEFYGYWKTYLDEHKQILDLSRANKNDEAKSLIRGKSEELFAQAQTALAKDVKLNVQGGVDASHTGDMLYASSRMWIIAMLAAVTALGAAAALYISRNVSRPLAEAVRFAQVVASGDLTGTLDVRRRDELGTLLRALQDMNNSLAKVVTEVRISTEMIAAASTQIASGNMDLSSRTEQQASSLEETASSMEELTSTVKQNADNARQANNLAQSASDVASKGGAVVSEVVETMGSINDSARKIVDIISVIDGIAFQTNILALNAAVEAARAGEQGRGFAVVASEVRSLAQRSANAAKEIKSLIDDSVGKVESGSRLVNQAGATMYEIVESVKRVTDIISEISAASNEQSSGIEQINLAVTQMDEVTQQNAALVEEAAAAAQGLQERAQSLAQTVGMFKVDASYTAASPVAATPRQDKQVHKLSLVSATAKHKSSLAVRANKPSLPIAQEQSARPHGGEWEEF
jgi:methyl-accepting chemotaxis protein